MKRRRSFFILSSINNFYTTSNNFKKNNPSLDKEYLLDDAYYYATGSKVTSISDISDISSGIGKGMAYGGAAVGGTMALVAAGPAIISGGEFALDAAQTAYLTTETALGGATATVLNTGAKVIDKTGQILLNEGKFAVDMVKGYGQNAVNWVSNPSNQKNVVDFVKGYSDPTPPNNRVELTGTITSRIFDNYPLFPSFRDN